MILGKKRDLKSVVHCPFNDPNETSFNVRQTYLMILLKPLQWEKFLKLRTTLFPLYCKAYFLYDITFKVSYRKTMRQTKNV